MSIHPSLRFPLSLATLWCLSSCEDARRSPSTLRASAAPADVGQRLPHADPVFVAPAACPPGVLCSASDHNGDGKVDLVRRDPFGIIGTAGEVTVAMAHGWGYGPFRPLAHGCDEDHLCLVADLDGHRGAELLRIAMSSGHVTRTALDALAGSEQSSSVVEDFCVDDEPRCTVIRAGDAGQLQLAWLDAEGALHMVDPQAEDPEPAIRETACGPGTRCRFAEANGEPGAELLVWNEEEPTPLIVQDLTTGEHSAIEVDCSSSTCEFADLDGDGRTDILQHGPEQLAQWWSSRTHWQAPLVYEHGAVCDPEDRCFWADGNGDGFDDLFRIEASGDLAFHPTLDAGGRLEYAAMQLSLLATRQTRADYAMLEAGKRAVLATLAPARQPSPYEATEPPLDPQTYDNLHTQLVDRIEALIAQVMHELPAETATETDGDVRRLRRLAMTMVAARTVLDAAPLGISRRATQACGNVVVHDHSTIEGVDHRAPSYLFRYAAALGVPQHHERVEQLVDAMTAITAGFRCLTNDELVIFDAALSDAVLQTAEQLRQSGRPMASRWLIDSAMPLVLLSFDAAKYSAVPPSYRLLASRYEDTVQPGPLPEAGFDFAHADDDPECHTFLCQTYGHARRTELEGRGLMLDELGVWLPDPLSSGRLRRLDIDPHDLLTHMLDLRIFGEGDCSLLEITTRGFTCPSPTTCDSAELATDSLAGVAIPEGIELRSPVPGDLGSPLTHLHTQRGPDLSAVNGCDGESGEPGAAGGAIVGNCMGPSLGSRRGRFSADPMIDTLMRCALDASSAPIDTDLQLGSDCVVSQDGPEDPEEPEQTEEPPEPEEPQEGSGGETESPTSIAEMYQQFDSIRQEILDVLRNGGTIRIGNFEYSRAQLAQALSDGFASAPRLTPARILDLLRGDVADGVEGARLGDLPNGTLGSTALPRSSPVITIDIGEHAGLGIGELARTIVHEAMHVLLMEAEDRGWVRAFADDDAAEARDHRITDRMGLRQCDLVSDCTSSCGLEDTFWQRFHECSQPVEPIDASDLQCAMSQDYCEDRNLGRMGAPLSTTCVPSASLAPEPECLVAHCADDGGPLASTCCGALSAPPEALPVFEVDVDPGPRPPRPTLEIHFDGWPVPAPAAM